MSDGIMTCDTDLIRITITDDGDYWRCVRERKETGETGLFFTLEECFDFIAAHDKIKEAKDEPKRS